MARGNIVSVDDLIKHDYVWAVGTAEEINAHNLGWWFVADYPLVTLHKRLQVRNIKQPAVLRDVKDYAAMMRLGDRFPPVIVTRDGFLVDGNTRTEAAKSIKWEVFPAFVVNVNYGELDADSPLRKTLHSLGAAQNNKHGRRMSAADIAALVDMVAAGSTPKQIMRDQHVGGSLANTVWNARKAKDKAASLGIELTGEMTNSMLKMFGEKVDKFTAPVWGRLFSLAQDSHMSVPDLVELIGRVKLLPDETARVALLESERAAHGPSIRTGVRQRPKHSRRVKQGFGYALREDLTPDLLTEDDPVQGPKYLRILMDMQEKLGKIIHAQEQVEEARRTI